MMHVQPSRLAAPAVPEAPLRDRRAAAPSAEGAAPADVAAERRIEARPEGHLSGAPAAAAAVRDAVLLPGTPLAAAPGMTFPLPPRPAFPPEATPQARAADRRLADWPR